MVGVVCYGGSGDIIYVYGFGVDWVLYCVVILISDCEIDVLEMIVLGELFVY